MPYQLALVMISLKLKHELDRYVKYVNIVNNVLFARPLTSCVVKTTL